MTKGLVITHGTYGRELVAVAEKIMEEPIPVDSISFDWQEDINDVVKKLSRHLNKNKEHDILIFTDMFGSSPTNICFKFKRKNMDIITGVNLPALLKFISYRDKGLEFTELAAIVKEGAINGINLISEYLGEKKS